MKTKQGLRDEEDWICDDFSLDVNEDRSIADSLSENLASPKEHSDMDKSVGLEKRADQDSQPRQTVGVLSRVQVIGFGEGVDETPECFDLNDEKDPKGTPKVSCKDWALEENASVGAKAMNTALTKKSVGTLPRNDGSGKCQMNLLIEGNQAECIAPVIRMDHAYLDNCSTVENSPGYEGTEKVLVESAACANDANETVFMVKPKNDGVATIVDEEKAVCCNDFVSRPIGGEVAIVCSDQDQCSRIVDERKVCIVQANGEEVHDTSMEHGGVAGTTSEGGSTADAEIVSELIGCHFFCDKAVKTLDASLEDGDFGFTTDCLFKPESMGGRVFGEATADGVPRNISMDIPVLRNLNMEEGSRLDQPRRGVIVDSGPIKYTSSPNKVDEKDSSIVHIEQTNLHEPAFVGKKVVAGKTGKTKVQVKIQREREMKERLSLEGSNERNNADGDQSFWEPVQGIARGVFGAWEAIKNFASPFQDHFGKQDVPSISNSEKQVKFSHSSLHQLPGVADMKSDSSTHQEIICSLKISALRELNSWNSVSENWIQIVSIRKYEDMTDHVQSELVSQAISLDNVLVTIKHTSALHCLASVELHQITCKIMDSSKRFSGFISKLLGDIGQYQAKMFALFAMDYLSRHCGQCFQDSNSMKEIARTSMKRHANNIDKMISEDEGDEYIQEMKLFEDAKLIDCFTSDEASKLLSKLLILQNSREQTSEAHFQSLLAAKNFKAIATILKSLDVSWFNIDSSTTKKKYQKWIKLLSSALKCIAIDAKKKLANPGVTPQMIEQVAECLETLDMANKHLEKFFPQGDFHYNGEKNTIMRKVHEVLAAKMSEMKSAVTQPDWALNDDSVLRSFVTTSMKNHITTEQITDIKGAIYQHQTNVVSMQINTFCDTCPTDGSGLLSCLQSLLSNDISFYKTSVETLIRRLNENYVIIAHGVRERGCFDEGIAWITGLVLHMNAGLENHISYGALKFDHQTQLEKWESKKKKKVEELESEIIDAAKLQEWEEVLEKSHPRHWTHRLKFQRKTQFYYNLCTRLKEKVKRSFEMGMTAINAKDCLSAQENIEILALIDAKLGTHIPMASKTRDELNIAVLSSFINLCGAAQKSLRAGGIKDFERFFPDYRHFICCVPIILMSHDGKKTLQMTNKLIYDTMRHEILDLRQSLDSLELCQIKPKLERVRASGSFVADNLTLLREEITCSGQSVEDTWLDEIFQLCSEHFGDGHDLSRIKFYSILGVQPSASESEIKEAYDERAKCLASGNRLFDHFQKQESNGMLKRIQDAFGELIKVGHYVRNSSRKPFDDLLIGLGRTIRGKARYYLRSQQYDKVEELLYKVHDLNLLDNLVNPPLDTQKTCHEVFQMVKSHVLKSRVDIDTNWFEQKYSLLNDNIMDLKRMEDHFKSFNDIFPESWNAGILQTIESRIECLGSSAHEYLKNEVDVNQKFGDFRYCLIDLGFIMIELPSFKEKTFYTISAVLDSCLSHDWGYGFLFKLGLSLQKGEENAGDERNRISQILVGEFRHFKEVRTLVWNEETCQKPVDVTVCDISGKWHKGRNKEELHIDSVELLKCFQEFDTFYKAFLSEYLVAEDKINDLIQNIIKITNKLKPVKLVGGWGKSLKSQLPMIIAGVFVVFTVLKSATTYNRINDSNLAKQSLMKPHNIQVLTLLCMLGCADPHSTSLENLVLQIRTGEGKSLILGAAAVVLALLGFRVRCICYSEYLSHRDYALFQDLFQCFQLTEKITYSKITSFSEDTTAAKGNIRKMTEKLLQGIPASSFKPGLHKSTDCIKNGTFADSVVDTEADYLSAQEEEVLLVDEFDVFFGPHFYGATYNQVAQLRDPEISEILKYIWKHHRQGGKKLSLHDIKAMEAYKELLTKYDGFASILNREIELMLHQVRLVNANPYYLNPTTNRIGHRILDTIEYGVTFGYCTMFAYLQEAEKGAFKDANEVLAEVLAMPVSCGQFSYARISAKHILGVSGTVESMGLFEHEVLARYGVEKSIFIPSVYGQSNFQFDKAGSGICIESGKSNFFHKINESIIDVAKQGRAVILFFRDVVCMKEYTDSAFFFKLAHSKLLLKEDMTAAEKDFAIKKAATAGQVTICTAAFGRGTDFFCRDDGVQRKGGVHVIHTFFSHDLSEEIQIQGRTARQGKKGTYQIIMLESDLVDHFGVESGEKDRVANSDRYSWLCKLRDNAHQLQCARMEENLAVATEKDARTHRYFDALLCGDSRLAKELFQEIYTSMKSPGAQKTKIDLAFVIDTTGSMVPYGHTIPDSIKGLVGKQGLVLERLKEHFPQSEFILNIAALGFRDIDDKDGQFIEASWHGNSHFTDNADEVIEFIDGITKQSSGGCDMAEDVLGALTKCAKWEGQGDWDSQIKFMVLLTDAPAHGLVVSWNSRNEALDNYSDYHPNGLTPQNVMGLLLSRGIDLFMCSFNPHETSLTEKVLCEEYASHPNNSKQREVVVVPLAATLCYDQHIVFVLDESGSMKDKWNGVIGAYCNYISCRETYQCHTDLVSIVQFSYESRVTVSLTPINQTPKHLQYPDQGGTKFHPASCSACTLAMETPPTHRPVIVFMSDGLARDVKEAANEFSSLNERIQVMTGKSLELHVIAFGADADQNQLRHLSQSSPIGKFEISNNTSELSKAFEDIARGTNLAGILGAEIGRRVSEAVSEKIVLEFMA